jgi:hypothetical protein
MIRREGETMVDSRGRAAYMGAVLILIVLVHMAGCASFGPRTLQRSHLNYNKAVQKAQMEEDLLNIVRLRYYDMPVFLSVTSISAQPSFSVGTSGEFGLVEGESSANITPDINYTDKPTITFVPSQHLDTLAGPVPLDTFVLDPCLRSRFIYPMGWLCLRRTKRGGLLNPTPAR